MLTTYNYHPFWFYLLPISYALIIGPVFLYLEKRRVAQLQMPLLLLSLCLPFIMSLIMIFASQNKELIADFLMRLVSVDFNAIYLLIILFFMPAIVYLATSISLLFGYKVNQFHLSKELSEVRGWAILGFALTLILAPVLEELGWRGYGVDSLRFYFNLFDTSLLFGLLWSAWHLPTFFVKGMYQNQLWYQNKIYLVNYFASIFVGAFMMNWIYYKVGRSIPALILFHSVFNLSAVSLRTEQFTKCIVTVLMLIFLVIVIMLDSSFFFNSLI